MIMVWMVLPVQEEFMVVTIMQRYSHTHIYRNSTKVMNSQLVWTLYGKEVNHYCVNDMADLGRKHNNYSHYKNFIANSSSHVPHIWYQS